MSYHKGILLVEGRDDREVIYQFCNHHEIDNQSLFRVESKNGIENMMDDLRVRVRTEVPVIGLVVDADTDPHERWHKIDRALAPFGYKLPKTPPQTGLCLPAPNPSRPRLGIWMMPDNHAPGMLEDFLFSLTNIGDPLLVRAEQAVTNIPTEEQRFRDAHRSKAIIHTWLAWQREPGTPLGLAIRRRYLDPGGTSAVAFLTWLQNVFAPPARPRSD